MQEEILLNCSIVLFRVFNFTAGKYRCIVIIVQYVASVSIEQVCLSNNLPYNYVNQF